MDNYIGNRAESYLEVRGRSFYSTDDVDRLCSDGRLSSDLGPMVAGALESAAQEWFENSAQEAVNIDRTEDDLARLSKAARQFSTTLNEAGRDAWDAMIDASIHGDIGYRVQLGIEAPHEFVPGSIEVRVDDLEERRCLPVVSVSDLCQLVDCLRELSIDGRFEMRKPGRGRPESRSLKSWVRRIHRFWVCDLKKPFRAGHMKGVKATTPASAFCVKAYRILDPDVPPQRIHTAMRKSITSVNQLRNSR